MRFCHTDNAVPPPLPQDEGDGARSPTPAWLARLTGLPCMHT
jgi:hypothetical protein